MLELDITVLEAIAGGAANGQGVITNYGGTPTVGDYTQGRVQNLAAVPANSTSYGVASNTGNGAGLFILNPWNPKTDTFF
jgi:hypothetical protein